ncbi:zinc ribbon domain-containing protein [bacterium]|nr:zinc ribbon domain-containing protein [candidate division CSSED10-310 bacterium]
MPMFEYKCDACGAINVKLVFNDSEELLCENCGSRHLSKMISLPAVPIKSYSKAKHPECKQTQTCCGAESPCGKCPVRY